MNTVNAIPEAPKGRKDVPNGELIVSELQVCRSAAGFYLGWMCIEMMDGEWVPQPYDRYGDYIATEEQAQFLLRGELN